MKNKVLFFTIISLFLLIGGTGCEKEDFPYLDIGPYSDQNMISGKSHDIAFEFYLLNEKGETSTVFNEGENITFVFAVKNGTKSNVVFDDFLRQEFFYVYDSESNEFIDKPYHGVWPLMVYTPHTYVLTPDSTRVFQTDWLATLPQYVYYPMSNNGFELARSPLPIGEYYTTFEFNAKYKKPKDEFEACLHTFYDELQGVEYIVKGGKMTIHFKVQ